jgi:trans-aconitate methyltransferase
MTPSDIARSYDQLADQWNSHRFARENGVAQHERAIAFVSQKRHALDVGCGASGRIVELLTTHGFEVEGIDISPRMVELARRRHPRVTFYQADIASWPLSRKYNLVSAWDSLWHVALTQQTAVLTKLLQGLNPAGVCIFTMGGADEPGEKVDCDMGFPMYSRLSAFRARWS